MREIRHSGFSVGYRGNGSGIASQREDCVLRVGGEGTGARGLGEAGDEELSPRLPAAEQPLPVLESEAGRRWWRNEPYIYEEL